MADERCATCFFKRERIVARMRGMRLVKENVVMCAYAPPRLPAPEQSAWPEIRLADWCGYWSPDGAIVSRWA